MATQTQLTEAQIRAVAKKMFEAWNRHDTETILEHLHPDVVWTDPTLEAPAHGKEAVRAALAGRFEGLPDVHYGDGEHFVDAAAEAGMSKWNLTGTARDGRRVEVRGCDFYTFKDGKVARKDSYWKIVE